MFLYFLYAFTLRLFLFEIKFESLRNKLERKHFLFETFLNCAFCNGFWSGVFVHLVFLGFNIEMIFFAVLVGVISSMVAKMADNN